MECRNIYLSTALKMLPLSSREGFLVPVSPARLEERVLVLVLPVVVTVYTLSGAFSEYCV